MPTNINGNTGIDKVQDGTVVSADIATLDASKLTGSIAAARIANNTIDSAHIASGAVDDAHVSGIAASKLTGALPAISAANLTAIPAANITGTLPAISGANLTGLPAGSVLQVVSTTITSNVSFGTAASDAWVDIKSLAITPSATSSKILIIWNFLAGIRDGNYPAIKTQWLRDSTVVYGPTRLECYYGKASNTEGIARRSYVSGTYLDSPNTTSAVTYKIQGDNESGSSNTGTYGGNIYAGSGAGANTAVTLMEIAG